VGIVRVKPGCFGTQQPCRWTAASGLPVELAKFASTKAVLIMKFRDKMKYVRLGDVDKLSWQSGEKTTKTPIFPIQMFI
jgi:hypothetical protein